MVADHRNTLRLCPRCPDGRNGTRMSVEGAPEAVSEAGTEGAADSGEAAFKVDGTREEVLGTKNNGEGEVEEID